MTKPRAAHVRNLIAACVAITIFGFAFGMTYPLLSLILEGRGVSSDMIGINSAMMPLGILLFSSVIPVAAKRCGASRLAIAAAILTALLMLSYKLFDTLAAWFVIRLVQGMTISTLFVLSEAWIVDSAGDANRGKVVAIYSSVLSASFGAGPLMISFIGIDGWAPFVIGAAVLMLGAVAFVFVDDAAGSDPEETPPSGVFDFAPKAPMLLAAVAVFSVFDAATMSLFPIYGVQNGLDVATSANIVTALVLGNTVLQLPIGWLADRFAYRWVLTGCATMTSACLLLLPLAIDSALRWPLLVLLGTSGFGLYTISLAALGNRFSGTELVNGTASFAIVWGLGALIGSIAGGWAMLGFGPHGLPIGLAVICSVLAIGVVRRQLALAKAGA